jgi:translation initiation factor IF-2
MNDRVRIYELARKMNIANEDIITALRELGYDIKSHSSTIDSNTVGLLIAQLGKTKEKDKAKAAAKPGAAPATGGSTTSGKTSGKQATPLPPPAPVVKPRVLSRYRPTPIGGEATEVAALTPSGVLQTAASSASNIATAVAPPLIEAAPAVASVPQSVANTTQASPATGATQPIQAPVPVVETEAKTATHQASAQPAQSVEIEHAVKEKHAPSLKEAQPETEAPLKKEPTSPVPVQDVPEKDNTISFEPPAEPKFAPEAEKDDNASRSRGQAMRPMTPSVPVRIAAPSTRATQPRPPKHRPTPSNRHSNQRDDKQQRSANVPVETPKIVTLTTNLAVNELATKMGVPETELIKRMMQKGIMRTVNQMVELELAKELALEMEYEVLAEEAPVEEVIKEKEILSAEDEAALVTRPPVVTIMGHVDHGKTSLLDAIRQTKFQITAGEAGGITQHIGAYHVEIEGEDGNVRQIVFLDTPGHEAFTAMRARGAKATDIAILVVAADDGVMPQTIEAIDHVKAAGVPIIVAVNKIDKADADPDRVLSQLMEYGLLAEKYGGATVTCEVSAKKRTGLNELLEMILLVADVGELKANPDKPASGVIIEAELSRGRGPVATALVENGTLREGDIIVAGTASGRVRALHDDRGARVKAAGPSMPVEVLGLDEVPQAGDRFEVVSDLQIQKQLVESRKLGLVERRNHHVSLESLHDMLQRGEVKDLNVIVKADVQGTAEAIADSVRKLSGNEVQVRVLRTASGDISENDVNLAASSNAIVLGFNVSPDQNAKTVAETAGVDIRTYNIIYQITDDLEKAIQGLIQPSRTEVQTGTAEVRQIFKFGKNLTIAGCMVINGKVNRGAIAKVDRGGTIVYEGKLDTLKRFKDDAKEVAQGFECGMSFDKFSDVREGDLVHCYKIEETKREITRS